MNDDTRTPGKPENPGGTEDPEAVSDVNGTDSAAEQGAPAGQHPTGDVRGTGNVLETGNMRGTKAEWPLYEIFVRGKRGLNHVHVGSLRAADDRMALTHARDLYTRRNEGVSLWAVRSDLIAASAPDEKDPFFAPNADKVYRHPTFYEIPADVPHI